MAAGPTFFLHILVATDRTVPMVYHTPLTYAWNPPTNGREVGPVGIFEVKNGVYTPKSDFSAISAPEGLERRVRCLNRGS